MPIITVSRGTFSGGRAIAECLAERLGYPCASREMILEAAAQYGVPVTRLKEAMEKPPSFWQRLAGERTGYIDYFRAALCERASKGELVYHGYVGHMLLTGISHVIRVRVIAGWEFRIEAAGRERRLGRKEAIDYITKVDTERARWMQFMYGVNWYDASLYDVVLNLEHMSLESACEVLTRVAQLPDFQPTAASMRAVEDLALSSRVRAALSMDARTRTNEVQVAAKDGVVTITGSAWFQQQVEVVRSVAGQVAGVKEVLCDVTLTPPPAPD